MLLEMFSRLDWAVVAVLAVLAVPTLLWMVTRLDWAVVAVLAVLAVPTFIAWSVSSLVVVAVLGPASPVCCTLWFL